MRRIFCLVVFLSGCVGDLAPRVCSDDEECLQGGEGGVCVLSTAGTRSKWCAFASTTCTSSLKWGLLAGDGLGSSCVVTSPTDDGGARPDAPIEPPSDAPPSPGDASPGSDGPAGADGGIAVLSLDEDTYHFGAIASGEPAQHTFTVKNVGTALSGQLHVEVSGTNSADFAADASGCENHVLGPDDGCPVVVTFSASATTTEHAVLAASAVPGGGAMTAMDGSALPPDALSADPPSIDFEPTVTGMSMTVPLTIHNISSTPTDMLTTSLMGSDAGQFAVISDNCATHTIPAMSTCSLIIEFAPTTAGTKAASVVVGDGTRSASVALSGKAVAPGVLTVVGQPSFAQVTLPGSTTGTATVKNTGGSAMTGVAASLSGTNKADFSVGSNGCSGTPLDPGDSCQIVIEFQPIAVGHKAASLSISADSVPSASTPLTAVAVATLTIVMDGRGAGTVTSNPSGISCSRGGGSCMHDFDVASVLLSESTSSNVQFDGWTGGGCPKFGNCTVSLATAQAVHASFTTTSACVDPSAGNDSSAGTCAAPFKTIAKAVSVMGGIPAAIQLKPGTYNSGETFPIILPDDIDLVGDETNKGAGASPTVVMGEIDPGSDSTVAGVWVTSAITGIHVVPSASSVTIRNNTLDHNMTGLYLECAFPCTALDHAVIANAITNNTSNGINVYNAGALVQNNVITENGFGVLLRGVDTVPDFGGGSDSSTGGNILSCNTTMDMDYNLDQFAQVHAENNFWDHNPPTAGRDALHNFVPGIDYFTNGSGGEFDRANSTVAPSPCP